MADNTTEAAQASQAPFGVLDGAQTDNTTTVETAPIAAVTSPTDPALQQYRDMIAGRGETGRLLGQIKEVDVKGTPVILVHPGLKEAMNIIAAATPNVALAYNVPYVSRLLKSVVRYPREIQTDGLDYFDAHPELFEGVLSEADSFLSKFIGAN